jgi:hypothetical protein
MVWPLCQPCIRGVPKRALAAVAITLMRPLAAPYGPSERTSTTLVVVSLRLAATPRWGLGRGSARRFDLPVLSRP